MNYANVLFYLLLFIFILSISLEMKNETRLKESQCVLKSYLIFIKVSQI
jgi:hypothetical protein